MKSRLLSLVALSALALVGSMPAMAAATDDATFADKTFVVVDDAADVAVTKMFVERLALDEVNIAITVPAEPSYAHDQAPAPDFTNARSTDDKGVQAYAATRSRLW